MTATGLLALAIFGGKATTRGKWRCFGVAIRVGDYDRGALEASPPALADLAALSNGGCFLRSISAITLERATHFFRRDCGLVLDHRRIKSEWSFAPGDRSLKRLSKTLS